jgi:flagellar basal-body rod modification protein FlgD
METQSITDVAGAGPISQAPSATSSLGGDDFFKLLIAELTNQDPLEPTSNQDLLNQISSIRDIELSSNLSTSLESLTEQQRFASSAGLIGRFVTGKSDEEGAAPVSGTVTAIRFAPDGKAILELEGGETLPLDRVSSVMDADRAADALIGQFVTGLNREDPENPEIVEGVATGKTTDSQGRVVLELDTGENLLLSDIVGSQVVSSEA